MVIAKQERIKEDFKRGRSEDERKIEVCKREHLCQLEETVTDKSELEVEEDFFTLTCFSFLKVNAEIENGWGIKPEK